MDGPIKRFRYWTQHILPLVYLDSLSYQELLEKVVAKLNEIVDWANGYEDDLKAYVDQKYGELLSQFRAELQAYKTETDGRMDKMQSQIDGIIAEVDGKIAGLESRVDTKLQENEAWVKAQIVDLTAKVNAQLATIQYALDSNKHFNIVYVDAKIEELKRELPLFDQVIVRSPVSGKEVGLQECLDTMFETLRYWGLTAIEYDLLDLTAKEYDDRELTSNEYDIWGRKIFEIMLPPHSTFSEVTGRRVPLQQAVSELWEEQRVNGLTSEAYDANNWTAQDYDNLGWTAYRYDWGEGNGPGPTPAEEVYELIQSDVFNAGTTTRAIDTDSTGTAFKLKRVKVYFENIQGIASGTRMPLSISLTDGTYTLAFERDLQGTTNNQIMSFEIYPDCGLWKRVFVAPSTSVAADVNETIPPLSNILSTQNISIINKITLNKTSNQVAFNYKFYGVRA